MLITDCQFQRLMKDYNSSGVLAHAAMKADVDPKTARRYIRAGRGPQEMRPVHTWRTRQDPVEAIWAEARKVDGVVLGVLTKASTVDIAQTRNLIEEARPLQVTFHRAFDVCKDLDRALEDVIASGADRILTSGGKPDAMRGAARIAHLQKKAGDRIRIMAGGGIRVSNLRTIALKTGIHEVHTSLSEEVDANPSSERAERGVGKNGYKSFRVLEHDVREFKSALDAIAGEAKLGTPLK